MDDNATKVVKSGTPLIVTRSGILAKRFPISIPTVDVAINQDIKALIYDATTISTDFLVAQLQKCEEYILKSIVKGGTTVQSVNIPDLQKFELALPEIEEQSKIGNFFRTLDHTITLHQRKLDGLKAIKAAYLQQMFPAVGETVPRVRFVGFEGVWEVRKLGDVVERVQGNDGRMDLPTLTISAGNGWLDQRERFSGNIAGKEQENYTLLSKGELSYNKGNSKLAKYGVVFELKTHEETLVPRVYHSFKATQESCASFFEYMFATKIPDSELAKLITSGARMDGLLNIGFEAFMGIKTLIPTKAEQVAISKFFKSFDENITAQQGKLDQFKHLKAAYLQKMFA